jgi:hypothetical protein
MKPEELGGVGDSLRSQTVAMKTIFSLPLPPV